MTSSGKLFWPVPDVTPRIPAPGSPGSFWEDRGDRRHTGIDIYAPPGSRVVSVEDGKVLRAGGFTSPDLFPHWNSTVQVIINHGPGIFCRYAELQDVTVEEGSRVRGGEVIGHVGEVLNVSRISAGSPAYIRALAASGRTAMLHLEVYSSLPEPVPGYRGGNWFSPGKPPGLLDPADLVRDTLR
jgi:murein DD-endopeptidase MepM/ murein hydrolase activator NlpD